LNVPARPDANGRFTFGPADQTSTARGPITGEGWINPAGDYLFLEFTYDNFPGERDSAFRGTRVTGAAFQSGVMAYSLRDDFLLGGSKVPFIPFALNGDLGPGGVAYLSYAPSGPVPFLGGRVIVGGAGADQRWAASVLVGQVRGFPNGPFIRGEMRG